MTDRTTRVEDLLGSYELSHSMLRQLGDFHLRFPIDFNNWVLDFYVWLEGPGAMGRDLRRYFPDGVPDSVKSRQARYWLELFSGVVNDNYVGSRIRLGRTHAKIDLPLDEYIAGMSFSQSWFLKRISSSGLESEEKLKLIPTLVKLCALDTALVSASYAEAASQMQKESLTTQLAIMNGSVDPMLTFDSNGVIQFASATTLDVFGWSPAELSDRNLALLLPQAPHAAGKAGYDDLIGTPREVRGKHRTGMSFDAELRINPVTGTHGAADLFVGVVRDISERKAKEGIILRFSEGDLSAQTAVIQQDDPLSRAISRLGKRLRDVVEQADKVSSGEGTTQIELRGEQDELGLALNRMNQTLRASRDRESWLKSGQTALVELVRGDPSIRTVSESVVGFFARYFQASVGVVYVADPPDDAGGQRSTLLRLCGAFARPKGLAAEDTVELGEGLIGQVATDRKHLLTTCAPTQLSVSSGLTNAPPTHTLVYPFVLGSRSVAVLELGSHREFSETQLELLRLTGETVAAAVRSAQERRKVELLLAEMQVQSETLAAQQDSLQDANEKLTAQTQSMTRQKNELLTQRAQLSQSSQYKTEFLSNMSHELRTPLNSMLILSKSLADNTAGNLTTDQVEAAQVVHSGGQELLTLINEILDLSKIEAGRMEVESLPVDLRASLITLRRQFAAMTQDKGLELDFVLPEQLPNAFNTDELRLRQILKNLLSNAVKFTQSGTIRLSVICRPAPEASSSIVEIRVEDTGIGIPKNRQTAIFEAFQQADGSTTRNYGGTGLGLTISRRLSHLLGGELEVESSSEKGTCFLLTLSLVRSAPESALAASTTVESAEAPAGPSGKELPAEPERTARLLVVEDDEMSHRAIAFMFREQALQLTFVTSGELALEALGTQDFDCVLLDLGLPGMPGKDFLERLATKRSVGAPRVVVYTERQLSMAERSELQARASHVLCKGTVQPNQLVQQVMALIGEGNQVAPLPQPADAIAVDSEPTAERSSEDLQQMRSGKKVLLVDDDVRNLFAMSKVLSDAGLRVDCAVNGQLALDKLDRTNDIELVLMDIMMPVMNGLEAIAQIRASDKLRGLPVIALTANAMPEHREQCLEAGADQYTSKPVDVSSLLEAIDSLLVRS